MEVLEARDVVTLVREVNGSEIFSDVNNMEQGTGQLFVSVSTALTVTMCVLMQVHVHTRLSCKEVRLNIMSGVKTYV